MGHKQTTANAGLIYGLLIFLGGIIGYLKAGSIPSLIAGSTGGALCLVSSLIMARKGNRGTAGEKILILISVSLSFFFLRKFLLNPVLFPSGFMTVASIITAVLALRTHQQSSRSS